MKTFNIVFLNFIKYMRGFESKIRPLCESLPAESGGLMVLSSKLSACVMLTTANVFVMLTIAHEDAVGHL